MMDQALLNMIHSKLVLLFMNKNLLIIFLSILIHLLNNWERVVRLYIIRLY